MKSRHKKQLQEHADNPFAFVQLCQQAAKKSLAYPRFSAGSERYIKQLARRHAKLRPAPVAAAPSSAAEKRLQVLDRFVLPEKLS